MHRYFSLASPIYYLALSLCFYCCDLVAQNVESPAQVESASKEYPLQNDTDFEDLASGYKTFLQLLQEADYAQAASRWDVLVRKHWGTEFLNYAKHNLPDNDHRKQLVAALTTALETHPDDVNLYRCLSAIQMLREHRSVAIELYDKAITLEPQYAWNYFFRAHCYRDDGLGDKADDDASRAVALEPQNDKFLFFRGNLRGMYQNKLADGLIDMTAAIALKPNEWEYVLGRAKLRVATRDYSAAIADSTAALRLCEQQGPIESLPSGSSISAGRMPIVAKMIACYQVRSDAFLSMKDYPAALAAMSHAIDLAGTAFPHLYISRAAIKIQQKDYAGALVDYNSAAQHDPFYDKNEKRAWVKLQLKDYRAALDEYNAIIPPDGGSWEQLLYRGITKQRLGDIDGAFEDLDESIRIGIFRPESYVARGMLRADCNDLQGAIFDFNAAIMHDRRHVAAYYQRGLANYGLKNFEGAVYDFGNVLSLDPDNTNAYFNRGLAQRSLEKFPAALESFDSVIKLDSGHVRAYYFRGLTLHDLGEYNVAIAQYDHALAIDPKFVNAYVERAMSRIYVSDLKAALADYDAAIRIDQSSDRALAGKSFLLATSGDPILRDAKAASDLADRALALDSPYAINARACADAAAGDFASAIRLQEQALLSGKFVRDKNYDGGQYAKERLAAWKANKLWTIPLAAKK